MKAAETVPIKIRKTRIAARKIGSLSFGLGVSGTGGTIGVCSCVEF